MTVIVTRDHAQHPAAAGKLDLGNLFAAKGLVAGRRQLVPGGQVHPQLNHLEQTAVLREFRTVKLFMDDAAGGGHPLHIARADDAAPPGGIAVFNFTGIDDGDRLETAVRMFAYTAPLPGGRELHRPGIVQEQKRRQLGAPVVVAKDTAYRKTIAHPMALVLALYKGQFLHDIISLIVGIAGYYAAALNKQHICLWAAAIACSRFSGMLTPSARITLTSVIPMKPSTVSK